MKLRRLQIENFRGIRTLELILGSTTVLIGENNAGKTAVLDAIRFALKEVRSRRGCAFDPYDFHLAGATTDPTAALPILIRLTFQEETPGEWGATLLGTLTRARILQLGTNGEGTVIFEVTAQYDPVSRDFVQNWRYRNLVGDELQGLPDSAISHVQGTVTFFYLAALRDSARHFDPRGQFWRPFLKDSQLSEDAKVSIETKLEEINKLIIESHTSFTEVVAHLESIKKVVPVGGDSPVSIEAVPGRLFDMLSKAQVNVTAETGAKIPIFRHGEGTQSLSVLMLFNAFLLAWPQGLPFIALEEPEAHLHPSATRALWKLLDQLPGQKIVSTHSGDLLSEVPLDSVVRLGREEGQSKAWRLIDAAFQPAELRKFNFHIRHARGELLFARCWILGEGETEVSLIPEAARTLGLDLERAGVRCLQYQQAGIDLYLKVAKTLNIAVVAFCDNDAQGGNDIPKVETLLHSRGHWHAIFPTTQPTIEGFLCSEGFGAIYLGLLDAQGLAKVTVAPGHADYWSQVGRAIGRKSKIPAAEKVVEAMRDRTIPVPNLIRQCIETAIELAATH